MLKRLGIAACLSPLAGWKEAYAADRKLDAPFDELIQSVGFTKDGPGLAVLVHQPGQPEYMRCTGLATLKERQPVTSSTMFELASVTKSITGTAVLMLQDRRQLKVTDDVRKYIPELPEYDKKNPIQIRHLAQHTSGLASYFDLQDVPSKNPGYWLNSDYVGEFARQNVPLDFPTGQKFAYNNTNYLLLAVVIARVTGKAYGEFLRDAIFDPAGMKTAFASEGPGSVPSANGRVDAVGYGKEEGEWKPLWGLPPARREKLLTCGDGAVWCSLEDMLAWDKALRAKKADETRISQTGRHTVTDQRWQDKWLWLRLESLLQQPQATQRLWPRWRLGRFWNLLLSRPVDGSNDRHAGKRPTHRPG